MASRAVIFERLQELVADKLSVAKSDIHEESNFIDDLNADSLDIVDLVMGIEDKFNLQIPDDHAERIVNVKNAIDYIMDHLGDE